MKPSCVFLANVYTLIYINYSLAVGDSVVLTHQLKYNLGLYPNSNSKNNIFIDSYSSVACAKSIINNNSDQLFWK